MSNREWIERFREYLMEQRGFAYNTAKNYLVDLRQFIDWLGDKSVHEVKKTDIEQYIQYLSRKGMKATSINRKLSTIRHFFKFLEGNEAIDKNPSGGVHSKKAPKKMPTWLDDDESRKMVQVAAKKLRDRLIIKLMAFSGLRVSEVLGLRVCDVDINNGYVLVRGKGNKERRVPVTPDTLDDLAAWIYSHDLRDLDLLFCMTPRNVQVMVKRYAQLAGVRKRVTPHVLRHTFATKFAIAGSPISVIQDLLGHEKIETTRRYIHIADNILKREYERVMGGAWR